jgi:hypothetical protein
MSSMVCQKNETSGAPIHIVQDGALCRLAFWSDEEWDALPPDERPRTAVFAPGLGWVGAVPVLFLN